MLSSLGGKTDHSPPCRTESTIEWWRAVGPTIALTTRTAIFTFKCISVLSMLYTKMQGINSVTSVTMIKRFCCGATRRLSSCEISNYEVGNCLPGCRNTESIIIVLTISENLLCLSSLMLQITGSAVVHFYQNVLRHILLQSKLHLLLGRKPQTSHLVHTGWRTECHTILWSHENCNTIVSMLQTCEWML